MHMRDAPDPGARCFGAPYEFPSTARAARHAARLWFQTETELTAAQFRDERFREHCAGRKDSQVEYRIRRAAFHRAFAEAIGHIVVEEGRFHAATA